MRNGAISIGLTLPPPMALRMATIICAMLPILDCLPFRTNPYFTSGISPSAQSKNNA
ncbi:MAG: hypothetical protein R2912_09355 [Eubacteriales bacterium]